MKALACVSTLAFVTSTALAQKSETVQVDPSPAYQPCLTEHDDAKRLACLDKALKYSKPDVPAKVQPKPLPQVSILLRQKADFNSIGGEDLVAKPAQLTVNRADGKDGSIVTGGLIGVFRPINALGWQPYVATAWNRDATDKTPRDLRDAAVGITGPLWDAYEPRWTISPNIRFRHRIDLYGTQDGNALVMQGNLIILPLVNSAPGKDKFSYVLVPYFGAQAENRQGGGSDEGHWRSSYLGANLNANLNMLMPRLSAAATVQWFRDQFAPANNLRRTKTFQAHRFPMR
jgi:hypothetical protein